MGDGGEKRFAQAWFAFALALGCHVADEAAHDFLSFYNPKVLAIRARFPFLRIPTFTFREWMIGLLTAVLLLLSLTPLARRGLRWVRITAIPLGIVIGIANGTAHIVSSLYLHRLMPGVLTGPLIILAGAWLIYCAIHCRAAQEGMPAASTG